MPGAFEIPRNWKRPTFCVVSSGCVGLRFHLLMAYNTLGDRDKTQRLIAETQTLGPELVRAVDLLVSKRAEL